jgi:hypothetical protein
MELRKMVTLLLNIGTNSLINSIKQTDIGLKYASLKKTIFWNKMDEQCTFFRGILAGIAS